MSLLAVIDALEAAGVDAAAVIAAVREYEARRLAEREKKLAPRRIGQRGSWERLRHRVFQRDGYVCVYCSEPTLEPHCDHVLPVSRGGVATLDNLATACPACNIAKGAKTLSEWMGER